jgi:hypothetical protein
MANEITGNPWTLDTTGLGLVWQGNIRVDHFEMIDYTADADVVVLKDQAGRVVWEGNGAVDLRPVKSGSIGWVYGGLVFASSSNAATRVRVYLKDK